MQRVLLSSPQPTSRNLWISELLRQACRPITLTIAYHVRALVRPGRFDKKVVVPLPDVKGRAQILIHHMRDILSDIAVDPTIIARGTTGFSGADLQNLVNQVR